MGEIKSIFISTPPIVTAKEVPELDKNFRKALRLSMKVWDKGYYVYTPAVRRQEAETVYILSQQPIKLNRQPIKLNLEDWLLFASLPWIKSFDAYLYVYKSDESSHELDEAKKLGLKIYKSLEEIPKRKRNIPKNWDEFLEKYYRIDDLKQNDTDLNNKKIYIAGPYSSSSPFSTEGNVYTAYEWSAELFLEKGYLPYTPHASHYYHIVYPHPYEHWLYLDRHMLNECNYFFIFKESNGAKMEMNLARKLHKKIHTIYEEIPIIKKKSL